jgi:hypothetical protein
MVNLPKSHAEYPTHESVDVTLAYLKGKDAGSEEAQEPANRRVCRESGCWPASAPQEPVRALKPDVGPLNCKFIKLLPAVHVGMLTRESTLMLINLDATRRNWCRGI